jgi:hypothetical protein
MQVLWFLEKYCGKLEILYAQRSECEIFYLEEKKPNNLISS